LEWDNAHYDKISLKLCPYEEGKFRLMFLIFFW
jgi:hypothetical protein